MKVSDEIWAMYGDGESEDGQEQLINNVARDNRAPRNVGADHSPFGGKCDITPPHRFYYTKISFVIPSRRRIRNTVVIVIFST